MVNISSTNSIVGSWNFIVKTLCKRHAIVCVFSWLVILYLNAYRSITRHVYGMLEHLLIALRIGAVDIRPNRKYYFFLFLGHPILRLSLNRCSSKRKVQKINHVLVYSCDWKEYSEKYNWKMRVRFSFCVPASHMNIICGLVK